MASSLNPASVEMEINEAEDMQMGVCYLCKEDNSCIPLKSEVGVSLDLRKKAEKFLDSKLPLEAEENPMICTTCMVLLLSANEFMYMCRKQQKLANDKLKQFYATRKFEDIWSSSLSSPVPRVRMAPCQLCAERSACVAIFSDLGLSLRIPGKVKSVTGIRLKTGDHDYSTICLICLFKLNSLSEKKISLRSKVKVLHSKEKSRKKKSRVKHEGSGSHARRIKNGSSDSRVRLLKEGPSGLEATLAKGELSIPEGSLLRDEPSVSGVRLLRDEPSTSGAKLLEDEPSASGARLLRDEPSASGAKLLGDEPSAPGARLLRDEPSASGARLCSPHRLDVSRTPSPIDEEANYGEPETSLEDPLAIPEKEPTSSEMPSHTTNDKVDVLLSKDFNSPLVIKEPVPDNPPEPEARPRNSLERKTVCKFCKVWLPRAFITEHEMMHLKKPVKVILCDEDTPSTS